MSDTPTKKFRASYSRLIEVGYPGEPGLMYRHFMSVGRAGKILATPGTKDGYVFTMLLAYNTHHYDYLHPAWQHAAEAWCKQHLEKCLVPAASSEMQTAPSNVEAGEIPPTVSIETIGAKPLFPVATQLRRQSARGLEVHFLIKGVQFEADDLDGFGVAPPAPIPLTAMLPNGFTRVDATSGKKVPEVEATQFRLPHPLPVQVG